MSEFLHKCTLIEDKRERNSLMTVCILVQSLRTSILVLCIAIHFIILL